MDCFTLTVPSGTCNNFRGLDPAGTSMGPGGDMEVVILCGGQGTRIRDVADDVPKPMIPIGGRPILWHIMKSYAQHGFTDFVLCLGYKSWVIKRYFLDYHLAGADFSLRLGCPADARVHGASAAENWHVTLAE